MLILRAGRIESGGVEFSLGFLEFAFRDGRGGCLFGEGQRAGVQAGYERFGRRIAAREDGRTGGDDHFGGRFRHLEGILEEDGRIERGILVVTDGEIGLLKFRKMGAFQGVQVLDGVRDQQVPGGLSGHVRRYFREVIPLDPVDMLQRLLAGAEGGRVFRKGREEAFVFVRFEAGPEGEGAVDLGVPPDVQVADRVVDFIGQRPEVPSPEIVDQVDGIVRHGRFLHGAFRLGRIRHRPLRLGSSRLDRHFLGFGLRFLGDHGLGRRCPVRCGLLLRPDRLGLSGFPADVEDDLLISGGDGFHLELGLGRVREAGADDAGAARVQDAGEKALALEGGQAVNLPQSGIGVGDFGQLVARFLHRSPGRLGRSRDGRGRFAPDGVGRKAGSGGGSCGGWRSDGLRRGGARSARCGGLGRSRPCRFRAGIPGNGLFLTGHLFPGIQEGGLFGRVSSK